MKNTYFRKKISMLLSIAMILSVCSSFPSSVVNAAGNGQIGVAVNPDGDKYHIDVTKAEETGSPAEFNIMFDEEGMYKIVCDDPVDSDNESAVVSSLYSLSVKGVTVRFNDSGSSVYSIPGGINLSKYGTDAGVVTKQNTTLNTAYIKGEGRLSVEGSVLNLSQDFKRSESCTTINSSGTISAPNIDIDTPNNFNNDSGILKATTSFSKGDFDLGGKVETQSDTMIISEGGKFTLKVGDKEKSFDGYVEGKASSLMKKEHSISLDELSDKYLGESMDFSDRVSDSVSDYDGTIHFEFRHLSDDPFSESEPDSIGGWEVIAVAPETDTYQEASSDIQNFEITYLPLSKCKTTSSGKYLEKDGLSNGNYARNAVYLIPDSGFEVKSNLAGSEFASQIELSKDKLYPETNGGNFYEGLGFYLKDKDTGAQTDQYEYYNMVDGLKNIIFDEEYPVFESFTIDGVSGSIEGEEEVRAKNVKIVVSDDYLESVSTEDKTYSRDNGGVLPIDSVYKATVELDAVPGSPQEIGISALDMSGNEEYLWFILKYPLITPTASVSVEDVYVGTEISPVLTTNSDGKSEVEYRYKRTEDSDFLPEVPTSAGTYDIQATIPETDTYEAIDVTSSFKIMKKAPDVADIKVPDTLIGQDYEPVLTTDSDGKSEAKIEYKKDGEDDSKYSETKPTAAGKYVVRATIPETDNYEKVVCTSTFKIVKKDKVDAKVEVPDTVIGTDYEPVLTTDSDGKADAKFEYKKDGEDDDKYTETKPTAAGKYVVRATVPETDNYQKIVVTNTFTIKKKTPSTMKVSVSDVYVDQDYDPVLTTDSDGKDKATFTYKGENDDSYSKDKPTKAGKYTVKAKVPATDTYEAAECTSTFNIMRNPVEAKVVLGTVIAGLDYTPKVKTKSNGAVEFFYKESGEADGTFTKTQPISPGKYVVEARIGETDKYEAVTCQAEFNIVYLTTPENPYTLYGTPGKHDFFVSDVYLKAADDFAISTSFLGTYMRLLGFNNDIETVYLRRTDGALTGPIRVKETAKIDKVAPVIMDGSGLGDMVGLVDGKVIYADEMVVKVTDEYLANVTVNGAQMSSNDTVHEILLDSDTEDGTQFYQLIAEDLAGNTNSVSFTLMQEWLKDLNIPIGKQIPLVQRKQYNLPGGKKYRMSGDPTVYYGGRPIYPRKTGKYTFSEN